jgi:hypothetical protein
MRKTHISKIITLAALCSAFSAACGGGGGGGMSQAASAGTPANMTPSPIVMGPDSYDTGIAGSVATPAAATFGSAPAQLASSGGSTFDGTSGTYPSNVTFPLLISSLQKSGTGLSQVSGNQGATVTVVNSSFNSSTVQIMIPSLGVNVTDTLHSSLASGLGQYIDGLSYVVMGAWIQRQTANSPPILSDSEFVFGFATPQAAMPTSGTAVFSGGVVQANVYKTVGTEIQTTAVVGTSASSVSISANFGSGAVTGSFTKMQTVNSQTWNDVTLNANISTGTNTFSGSTAAASSPGGSMSLSGSATGRIDGAFYGRTAQQLGAVWSLSDGTGSALGTVVAGH